MGFRSSAAAVANRIGANPGGGGRLFVMRRRAVCFIAGRHSDRVSFIRCHFSVGRVCRVDQPCARWSRGIGVGVDHNVGPSASNVCQIEN